jgi:hypothetical protein
MATFSNIRSLSGRTKNGNSNRVNIKITLTPDTLELLKKEVEFGKGKYGSSLIELSIRTLLTLVGNGEDIEMLAKDLQQVSYSPYMANNLRLLAKYLEA